MRQGLERSLQPLFLVRFDCGLAGLGLEAEPGVAPGITFASRRD